MIDLTLAGTKKEIYSAVLEAMLASDHCDAVLAVVGSSAQFHPQLAVEPIIGAHPAKPLAVFIAPAADTSLDLLRVALQLEVPCIDCSGALAGRAEVPLLVADVGASPEALRKVDTVLIDSRSRPEFGPQVAGTMAEAGAKTVTIAGLFTMGTGFGADGAIVSSMRTFARLLPSFSQSQTSIGLVSVSPEADVDAVADRLRVNLPADVRVFTREKLAGRERAHWIIKTSVGVIFLTGVVTSLIVGMAIVSQVLGNKVAHHFKEYATMKALGYSQRYISRVVLLQAVAIAVIGYIPGLLVAWQLYGVTRTFAHIPMRLGWREAGVVLGLAVTMCVTAALTSLVKVARAAPADLF
jgi:DevC protein